MITCHRLSYSGGHSQTPRLEAPALKAIALIGSFYDHNVSIFSEAWNESFHDDPLFLFHFWVIYMYIFHFVKGQDNLNSRSKMAHLPLRAF